MNTTMTNSAQPTAKRAKTAAKATAKPSTKPLAAPRTRAASADIALNPLLALGTEAGVFVIVVAPSDVPTMQSFGRFDAEPLPRLVSKAGYLDALTMASGQTIYTAYIPCDSAPTGSLQLGCTTTTRRKPLFKVNCLPYQSFATEALLELLKRFGRALVPAFKAILPEDHVLRKNISISTPAAAKLLQLQGQIDGVIDGVAHGWVQHTALEQKSITVDLMQGDEVFASGPAEFFLQAVPEGRNGRPGCHRFRLRLSYELLDGKQHTLHMRARSGGHTSIGAISTFSATFEVQQPTHFDWMPRSQTMAFALKLSHAAHVNEPKAMQILLQSLSQLCLLQETGQLHEARTGYQQLASLLGANTLCHCKIADCWLLENKPDLALAAYQAAVTLDADCAWAHLGMGNALRLDGKPQQAEEAYSAALACAPDFRPAQQRLIDISHVVLAANLLALLQVGDKLGAIALLQSA